MGLKLKHLPMHARQGLLVQVCSHYWAGSAGLIFWPQEEICPPAMFVLLLDCVPPLSAEVPLPIAPTQLPSDLNKQVTFESPIFPSTLDNGLVRYQIDLEIIEVLNEEFVQASMRKMPH